MRGGGGTPRTLLGFDYGQKRIGVAVGQGITGSATPVGAVSVRHGRPDWARIADYIKEWRPEALVVGIPYHMDGGEQPMTEAARRFCRQLAGRYHLPVYEADERLSSREARQRLGRGADRSSGRVDAVAAQLILQSWLQDEAAES